MKSSIRPALSSSSSPFSSSAPACASSIVSSPRASGAAAAISAPPSPLPMAEGGAERFLPMEVYERVLLSFGTYAERTLDVTSSVLALQAFDCDVGDGHGLAGAVVEVVLGMPEQFEPHVGKLMVFYLANGKLPKKRVARKVRWCSPRGFQPLRGNVHNIHSSYRKRKDNAYSYHLYRKYVRRPDHLPSDATPAVFLLHITYDPQMPATGRMVSRPKLSASKAAPAATAAHAAPAPRTRSPSPAPTPSPLETELAPLRAAAPVPDFGSSLADFASGDFAPDYAASLLASPIYTPPTEALFPEMRYSSTSAGLSDVVGSAARAAPRPSGLPSPLPTSIFNLAIALPPRTSSAKRVAVSAVAFAPPSFAPPSFAPPKPKRPAKPGAVVDLSMLWTSARAPSPGLPWATQNADTLPPMPVCSPLAASLSACAF